MPPGKRLNPRDPLTEHDVAEKMDKAAFRLWSSTTPTPPSVSHYPGRSSPTGEERPLHYVGDRRLPLPAGPPEKGWTAKPSRQAGEASW